MPQHAVPLDLVCPRAKTGFSLNINQWKKTKQFYTVNSEQSIPSWNKSVSDILPFFLKQKGASHAKGSYVNLQSEYSPSCVNRFRLENALEFRDAEVFWRLSFKGYGSKAVQRLHWRKQTPRDIVSPKSWLRTGPYALTQNDKLLLSQWWEGGKGLKERGAY